MPQGSTTLHESEDSLRPSTRDLHRAIVSLMEELEAIDWYQQATSSSPSGGTSLSAIGATTRRRSISSVSTRSPRTR